MYCFPLTSKNVTLDNLEWPFYVKFCFCASTSRIFLRGFEKQYCVKTNKDRPIPSAKKCSSFWRYKVYAGVLQIFTKISAADLRIPEPIFMSYKINSYIMTRAIPDWMALSGLFQRAVMTVETDKFRMAQFCVLLHGFLVIDHTSLHELSKRVDRCCKLSIMVQA